MGCFGIAEGKGISHRVARQMRVGIALGELSYNAKVKGDIKRARAIMVQASKAPKYTYMSAIHTLANCISRGEQAAAQERLDNTDPSVL